MYVHIIDIGKEKDKHGESMLTAYCGSLKGIQCQLLTPEDI